MDVVVEVHKVIPWLVVATLAFGFRKPIARTVPRLLRFKYGKL